MPNEMRRLTKTLKPGAKTLNLGFMNYLEKKRPIWNLFLINNKKRK